MLPTCSYFCMVLASIPSKHEFNDMQVLIDTHGRSSYWDFVPNNTTEKYSYVRAASDAGYITFRYDQLGTGLSEHPQDAYKYVLFISRSTLILTM